MDVEINEVTPVEYEWVLRAGADEMEPRVNEALKMQQKQADLEGFRKGKVPMSLIKKRFGKAIGHAVAEQLVQERFEQDLEDGDFDAIGQATLTQLDYELDEDLRAVVTFGVRPNVELKDLSGQQVEALDYEVTDEDVDEEIDNFRREHADLRPLEDEPASETDYMTVDLQRIDRTSGTPILGEKEEDVSFFLDDDQLKDELREALVGQQAGGTVRAELAVESDDEDVQEETMIETSGQSQPAQQNAQHLYEVNVKDVKRRDLPELSDAFVGEVTDDEVASVEELRREVRNRMEQMAERQAREFLHGNIAERLLDLHSVPVPDSVVEANLDAFIEDVEERNDGELPDDFDEAAFRRSNRDYAEQQGRWMFIRDQVIEDEGLDVNDDELRDHLTQRGPMQLPPDQAQQMMHSNPELKEQVKQQLLSEKVFDVLKERLDVVEKDMETLQQEREAQMQQTRGATPTAAGPVPS